MSEEPEKLNYMNPNKKLTKCDYCHERECEDCEDFSNFNTTIYDDMEELQICNECARVLIFNAEFTYRTEGKKYKNNDWYYCPHCKTNTRYNNGRGRNERKD